MKENTHGTCSNPLENRNGRKENEGEEHDGKRNKKSGGEASIVAELVEVEENSTRKMQTMRIPPVIMVNKTFAYALLRDKEGHIIENTQDKHFSLTLDHYLHRLP
ncbi:hypothetical protein VNO80_01292 [Phaseolus coccineus]|uniref:Uncharacterized protein n=1 Tax=Phaseolus coccineus TaxID=3886 RepID=A0AAN9WYM0_PHACN